MAKIVNLHGFTGRTASHRKDPITEAVWSYCANEWDVEKISRDNQIDHRRWSNVSLGMQVTNLGNVLRTKAYSGYKVTIGSEMWLYMYHFE